MDLTQATTMEVAEEFSRRLSGGNYQALQFLVAPLLTRYLNAGMPDQVTDPSGTAPPEICADNLDLNGGGVPHTFTEADRTELRGLLADLLGPAQQAVAALSSFFAREEVEANADDPEPPAP